MKNAGHRFSVPFHSGFYRGDKEKFILEPDYFFGPKASSTSAFYPNYKVSRRTILATGAGAALGSGLLFGQNNAQAVDILGGLGLYGVPAKLTEAYLTKYGVKAMDWLVDGLFSSDARDLVEKFLTTLRSILSQIINDAVTAIKRFVGLIEKPQNEDARKVQSDLIDPIWVKSKGSENALNVEEQVKRKGFRTPIGHVNRQLPKATNTIESVQQMIEFGSENREPMIVESRRASKKDDIWRTYREQFDWLNKHYTSSKSDRLRIEDVDQVCRIYNGDNAYAAFTLNVPNRASQVLLAPIKNDDE